MATVMAERVRDDPGSRYEALSTIRYIQELLEILRRPGFNREEKEEAAYRLLLIREILHEFQQNKNDIIDLDMFDEGEGE
jgi:hypothetical protein